MKVADVNDYRELARRKLPPFLFEYIDGGSYDEVTLRRNVEDLRAVELRQRVLRDVSDIDLSVTLWGKRQSLPIILGPVGLGGMNAYRGEVQAARAAEAAGVPFTLSTVSLCSLAEVNAAVRDPVWFQLYMIRDRAFMRDLLARARDAATPVLVITVDIPLPGARYRDIRSGLAGADHVLGQMQRLWQAASRPGWAWKVGLRGRPHIMGNIAPAIPESGGLGTYLGWLRDNFDQSVTWRDLDFIRENWSGPIVIKGILDAEDAKEAAAWGADGIIVSNHGGRQLDGVPSTTKALPPIVEAVGDRLTVLVDGGVRSGLDIVRMLALGAKAVLLGRAWVYALAGAGEAGVAHLISLIEAEMRVAMALTGATRMDHIGPHMLVR